MSTVNDESLRQEQRFAKAVSVLQSLGPEEHTMVPTNDEKLQFYGLYKQATVGPCSTPRPSLWDVVGRSKWDAWNKVRQLTSSEAKEAYIDAVIKFLQRFPDRPLAAEVIEYFELSRAGLATDTDSEGDFSERDLSDVETHSLPEHGEDFDEPVDTPPHYEERPVSINESETSASSRILDGLIERVRSLEVEVSSLRNDQAEHRRQVKRLLHPDRSRLAVVVRYVKYLVPSALWNLLCIFFALLFFGYRPTANSKFVACLMWAWMKRQELLGSADRGDVAL
ncbi:uncharacterized protein SPPG_06069 [Spizellomyces punctatus DAOM BR117]|uniref:ACB domain-containing protein n=1 Tax=Spizellomyces punctatus (strain DAOM BR117) TaxID=645134 RepID=A0A0L0HBP6_SPIPD|nr:uncharacterized protein SPPG_06069 [Spizellomyces punctatus DAOM BR117]KNC98361.1 hypothetical protein SPPG_06069 [Spizellomyces punctatus DAOM BR117]|eukprot:XP_016606401.1 hypothetical protein SPPG_06069 [Spizellomyces punctatus DAOM BR117]